MVSKLSMVLLVKQNVDTFKNEKPQFTCDENPQTTDKDALSEDTSRSSKNIGIKDSVLDTYDYMDKNLLIAVHLLMPKQDSKQIIDRPTKRPLKEIIEDFKEIEGKFGLSREKSFDLDEIYRVFKNNTKHFGTNPKDLIKSGIIAEDAEIVLAEFLDKNFLSVESDIVKVKPKDYKEKHEFIEKLKNKDVNAVAKELNNVWLKLSREKAELKSGQESTLLDLTCPFFVPGGRFREYYYWDTYWILEGLLVCDMKISAQNIIVNFIGTIKKYGYIPNGLRKYYLNRTQPPYFTSMLLKVYETNKDFFGNLVLEEGLAMAEIEYEFFEKYRKRNVEIDGKTYALNYHHVETDFPRPESFGEDVENFNKQKKFTAEQLYSNFKSGAETGWDFSTRWLLDPLDLTTTMTSCQIPTDLNALLYKNERILQTLFQIKGDMEKSKKYGDKAETRKEAINAVLWNAELGIWNDYNFVAKAHVTHRMYISNVIPLFYGIEPPTGTIYNVIDVAKSILFKHPGGIPVSDDKGSETCEQWDYPNVWAPHQQMAMDYFKSKNEEKMAYHVARSFFNSIMTNFKKKPLFYEKYHADNIKSIGEGGEYTTQDGFGWTNGVALSIIATYGDEIAKKEFDHEKSYEEIQKYLQIKILEKNKMFESEQNERKIGEKH